MIEYRDTIANRKLEFQAKVQAYKKQQTLNRIFNCTYSKLFMPLTVGSSFIVLVLIQGSLLASYNRLPIGVIGNCVSGSFWIFSATRYLIDEGATIHTHSVNSKQLLLSHSFETGTGRGEDAIWAKYYKRKRILTSCGELKLLLFSNYSATEETLGKFVNAVLDTTITYMLFVRG